MLAKRVSAIPAGDGWVYEPKWDGFRHMAHFRRWRKDKEPHDCTYAQLEVVPPAELAAIFAK